MKSAKSLVKVSLAVQMLLMSTQVQAEQLHSQSQESLSLVKDLENYIQMQLEGKLEINAGQSSEQKTNTQSNLQMAQQMAQQIQNGLSLESQSFQKSEEKAQLDAEVKSILQANAAADSKIQALMQGKNQAEASEKVSVKTELTAESLSQIKSMVKSATQEGSQERLELKSYIQGRAEGKLDSDLENKWGFLKNIINIDVFFAGPQSEKSSDKSSSADDTEKTSRDVDPSEKIKPLSSWKPSKKTDENEVNKSTTREKADNGDLEDAIENGDVVTDSQGNIYPKSKKAKAEAIKDEIKRLEKKKEDLDKEKEVDDLEKKKEELEASIKSKEIDDKIGKNAKKETPSDSKILKRASTPEQRGKADKEQDQEPEEKVVKKKQPKEDSGPSTPQPDSKRASTPEQRGKADKREQAIQEEQENALRARLQPRMPDNNNQQTIIKPKQAVKIQQKQPVRASVPHQSQVTTNQLLKPNTQPIRVPQTQPIKQYQPQKQQLQKAQPYDMEPIQVNLKLKQKKIDARLKELEKADYQEDSMPQERAQSRSHQHLDQHRSEDSMYGMDPISVVQKNTTDSANLSLDSEVNKKSSKKHSEKAQEIIKKHKQKKGKKLKKNNLTKKKKEIHEEISEDEKSQLQIQTEIRSLQEQQQKIAEETQKHLKYAEELKQKSEDKIKLVQEMEKHQSKSKSHNITQKAQEVKNSTVQLKNSTSNTSSQTAKVEDTLNKKSNTTKLVKKSSKATLSKKEQAMEDAKMKDRFNLKQMDTDKSFRAVELVVPEEVIKNDKDLQKQLAPPDWQTLTYYFDNGECKKSIHASPDEAKNYYAQLTDPNMEKLIIKDGNVFKQQGDDTFKLGQCMGKAVMEGQLKRKSFAKGFYYIVSQTDLGNQPYNILERIKSQDQAKTKFEKTVPQEGYSKILVDGTSGRIIEREGPEQMVGQNLVYMYEHVQGKVFNGRFKE